MTREHGLPCRTAAIVLAVLALVAAAVAVHGLALAAETWNGFTVETEHRCAPYDKDDYDYPPSVEPKIVAAMGGRIYGPYTGRYFESMRDTDIEHIVARSEAHYSGLCHAEAADRLDFASDLLNLTLAAPEVNGCGSAGKCDGDAADWLPPMNKCWFVSRVIAVKFKYSLTVAPREAIALQRVLSDCTSIDMIFTDQGAIGPTVSPATEPARIADALRLYDDNSNGRITCKEARRHGIAPVPRGHPAYPFMRDGDGDGVVCE